MTHDAGIGIFCRQFLEQGEHRGLLGFSPGIIGMTFFIETALVANAEGATVVVAGMSSTDILGKNWNDSTVATNVIVVGGLAETSVASRNQGFYREMTVAAGCATVNNQQFNCRML